MKTMKLAASTMVMALALVLTACSGSENITWTKADAKKVVLDSWKVFEATGGQENFTDGGDTYRFALIPGGDYTAMYRNDTTKEAALVYEKTAFMLFNAWAMVQASDLTFTDTDTGFNLKVPDWAVPIEVTVKGDRVDTLSYSYDGTQQTRTMQYSVDEDLKTQLTSLIAQEIG